MNVLSLFDGISCGRQALQDLNISVDTYYSSEIDKYAIRISESRWPDIVRLGDVNKWKDWPVDWGKIDLILAGSPCQGFSYAGGQLAFDDPRSCLFFAFCDILEHTKSHNPEVKFLLENVKMNRDYSDIITERLGVEYSELNSNKLCAQSRIRFYWTNVEAVNPIEDNNVLLSDILEDLPLSPKVEDFEPASPTSTGESGLVFLGGFTKGRRLDSGKVLSREFRQGYRVYDIDAKAQCLQASSLGGMGGFSGLYGRVTDNGLVCRKLTVLECERLQTLPDEYTLVVDSNGKQLVSDTQRYKALGNGWTVAVISHLLEGLKL